MNAPTQSAFADIPQPDIPTSSNAYRYGLGPRGVGWSRINPKQLPNRIGNIELRPGMETEGMQDVLPKVAAYASKIAPWVEILAAPDIVGFKNKEEIPVRGASVVDCVIPVPGSDYNRRVTFILFNTSQPMKVYKENILKAAYHALEQEAVKHYGKKFVNDITASIYEAGDPDLLHQVSNDVMLRRQAFADYVIAKDRGADFIDGEEDAPLFERVFKEIYPLAEVDGMEAVNDRLGIKVDRLRNSTDHMDEVPYSEAKWQAWVKDSKPIWQGTTYKTTPPVVTPTMPTRKRRRRDDPVG